MAKYIANNDAQRPCVHCFYKKQCWEEKRFYEPCERCYNGIILWFEGENAKRNKQSNLDV